MTEEEAAVLFGALSNADRLGVIRILVEAGPDGLSAGQVAKKIGATPSRASFHLSTLYEVGIVAKERHSRSLIYSANFGRLGGLIAFLLDDCCKGNAALKACCGC